MEPQNYLDFDAETRQALEIDEVLAWIAEHTRTAAGAGRVQGMRPRADLPGVVGELERLSEIRRHQQRSGRLIPGGLPDPTAGIRKLGVSGGVLDASMLRAVAALASAGADIAVSLQQLDPAEYPRLSEIGQGIPDLSEEAAPVLRFVETDGRILDGASPELRRIRRARGRLADRLRGTLRAFFERSDAEAVIQDDFVTQRNGRYVIPVRVDAPRPIPGIVHATSSSGATRFVEPMVTVELNNDAVRLAEEEQQEIARILTRWSAGFASRRDEFSTVVERIAEVDSLEARDAFGAATGGVVPELSEDASLLLRHVRHPLLERRLGREGQQAVPLDLEIDPKRRTLVLSGPNAGGKTVALKTVGLAVISAQSGIPMPGRQVRVPLYRQLRADIGDHQSIESDLSTYSAHVKAAVGFLGSATPPALFLFDELGTGTEPAEGCALAQAVLEALMSAGVTTVATTHHGGLKTWAFAHPDALSAAMEFDGQDLRPTYRILLGVAGVSAGLDIAARMGMPRPIVEAARGYLGEGPVAAEAYMQRLRELTAAAEETRARLERREREVELRADELEAATRAREARSREKFATAMDRVVESFRRDAGRQLATIRDRQDQRRADRERAAAERALAAERSRRLAELDPTPETRAAVPERVEIGLRVWVRTLGREGVVRSVRGERVEVAVGPVGVAVRRRDLAVAAATSSQPEAANDRPTRAIPDEVSHELNLIGQRVDDALEQLERYLEEAAVAERDEVRIIHGHGTGKLRAAVREFLRRHPGVRAQRPGSQGEGGDGATIASLKQG